MTIQIAAVTLLALTMVVGSVYMATVYMPRRKLNNEWVDYVNAQVCNTLDGFDDNAELTFADRMEAMRDVLADLSIELYKNVKNKAVRMPMMAYLDSVENKLVKV